MSWYIFRFYVFNSQVTLLCSFILLYTTLIAHAEIFAHTGTHACNLKLNRMLIPCSVHQIFATLNKYLKTSYSETENMPVEHVRCFQVLPKYKT